MPESITGWLETIGMSQHIRRFLDADIDMSVLESLDNSDLRELGISLGHRKKILQAIESLHDSAAQGNSLPAENTTPESSPGDASADDPQRRQLTIMFVDLVGSTALSEQHDPEDLGTIMRSYQQCCQGIVERYDGYIARYMGDGILVYYGYPRAHENDIQRCLLSALDLINSVAKLKPMPGVSLQARIGVATGLVVVGETIGNDSSAEQVVVGETPNLAARLQSLASPGGIVVSALTRQLARTGFVFSDHGEQQIRGLSRPESVWQLDSFWNGTLPTEEFYRQEALKLTGRSSEIGLLHNRWLTACQGEGQVVLLDGEAGVGKSALTSSLHTTACNQNAVRLYCQCSELHANTAMFPLISQLERRADLQATESSQQKLDKLLYLFQATDFSVAHRADLLTDLMSLNDINRVRALSVTPGRQKQLTFELLIDEIIAMSINSPLLLVYEDIHWADPSTLQFIDALLKRIASAAILVLITHRPDATHNWITHAQLTRLTLSRLDRKSSQEIVSHHCKGKPLPEAVTLTILEKADGVPLYVEELTKNVLESGLVKEREQHFELVGELSTLAVPSSLSDSLMARLDRLPLARRIAQIASVIGREFDYSTLYALCDQDETITKALEQLEVSGIVFGSDTSPEASYRFKHALVQDAAYASMLNTQKRIFHDKLARHYISSQGISGTIGDEAIAEHLLLSNKPVESMHYRLQAGQKAIVRFAHIEAESQLRCCLRDAELASNMDGISENQIGKTKALAQTLLGDLAGYRGELRTANQEYETASTHTDNSRIQQWIDRKRHYQHHVESNDARLTYYTHGEGEQTLLLMNPIAYGLSVFQPLLDNLCQDYRVVTMDCRGTGLSDPLIRPYGIEQHTRDVAAIIEDLGGEPVTGIGISRGSNVLILLASHYPHLINRLITVGCPLRMPEDSGFPSFAEQYMQERTEYFRNNDVESLAELQYRFVYTESGTTEIRKASQAHLLKLPRDTILSFYDPDPGASVIDLLPDLKIDTLVMHGREDKLIPFTTSEYLTNQLCNARLYAFENQGHLPSWTATDEFCLQVRRFVDDANVPAQISAIDEWQSNFLEVVTEQLTGHPL